MAVLGILLVIVGFDLIADPLRGTVTLTIAVAFVLIADGVIRLIGVFTEPSGHRVLGTLIAVINIILGVWLWTGIPLQRTRPRLLCRAGAVDRRDLVDHHRVLARSLPPTAMATA